MQLVEGLDNILLSLSFSGLFGLLRQIPGVTKASYLKEINNPLSLYCCKQNNR